ncbi:hypothetical protein OOZ15_10285 [Galbibacter sp. EGI 63066]|uniref:hypothetical protein n=1 Tax=Galbibacter sp. EGI 63066 TaxID=2993559 RepID=UPI002248A80D|nr:hypothetical protein [Galbibacter sp. EGI 63066]MCX2680328.1 hypothetical protein [Galbibacter sp. EGI 63066]
MEKTTPRRYAYQYAVKLVCTAHIPGTSQTSDGLLPGVYETAVNIHNPSEKAVKLRKKLAHPGQVSKFKNSTIKSDGVERFVCRNIQDFGITFIHGFEGFLVIESSDSLDVTAVYTAGASGGSITSMDVEQIKERKL